MYQDISIATAGTYALDFSWDPGIAPNGTARLQVWFGLSSDPVGTNVFDMTINNAVDSGFVGYDMDVSAAVAGTYRLWFVGEQDPAFDALDNISLSSVVPEPASLTLGAIGLAGLAFGALRRRR